MGKTSTFTGFYKLSIEERLNIVREYANLTDEEVELLRRPGALSFKMAET